MLKQLIANLVLICLCVTLSQFLTVGNVSAMSLLKSAPIIAIGMGLATWLLKRLNV